MWWAASWLMAGFSLFGAIGLWRLRATMGRRPTPRCLVPPCPYYVFRFDPRYASPVLWLLMLFAGFAVWRLPLPNRTGPPLA